jgi:pyruvate formate lyase activating enzyme
MSVASSPRSTEPAHSRPGRAADALRIGGFTPLTSIDFPGRLAAVLFCQGCPWRCGYCHNPELLDATVPGVLPWNEVIAFLKHRRGLLDGVVFSGGEPLLQAALPAALDEVRALGFETALHTGGMYPDRLAAQLSRLDWVGLDIKGPWERIDAITRSRHSAERVRESLEHLLASGVQHECRTTWHPGLFGEAELLGMARDLAGRGVRHWVLQACRDPAVPGSEAAVGRLAAAMLDRLREGFERFETRTP